MVLQRDWRRVNKIKSLLKTVHLNLCGEKTSQTGLELDDG